MRRVILAAIALAAIARAELAFFTADPEQRLGAGWHLGTVAAGEALETCLRLRNLGAAPAVVTFLSLNGTAFFRPDPPSLPQTLAPNAWMEFRVSFQPTEPGVYSAGLQADGVSVILLATAAAVPALRVEENGGWRVLGGGQTVDFGPVERGAAGTRRFVVENQTAEPAALAVTGESFRLAVGTAAGVVAPGESRGFELVFSPGQAGAAAGTLQAGWRHLALAGSGTEPPLPQARVQVNLPVRASGQQGAASVELEEVSRTSGAGELRLDFEPAMAGAQDPAILFASGSRVAGFAIAEGDRAARFGSRTAVDFQTGSTAGTIVLTLALAGQSSQERIPIPPAQVGISAAAASRGAGSAELRITGFDNTRSAGQVSFVFYDRSGAAIPPGAIRVDAKAAFQNHFASAGMGGTFLFRAVFPVTGDAAQLAAVETEFANTEGVAGTGRVPFP